MRILLLARYLPAEGSTTHMYTLAQELIKRGHEVAIASGGPEDTEAANKIFKNAVDKGMVHVKMPFPLNPTFGVLGKLRQALVYIVGAPMSLYRIARWKPDVIHVHYPVTSFLSVAYRRLARVKFVMTYHITGIPQHPLHRRGDRAIAISDDLRKEIISKFAYDVNQVHLIHNGIDLSRFTTLDRSREFSSLRSLGLEVAKNKLIIGFVGTISPRKGLDILLDALHLLDKEKFHLVVVGNGETEWLNSLITSYKLDGNVSVFPFSTPEDYYSIFDVFVLPSRKEGFPLVPLEAMASGVLTIRSNVEGASDQIADSVTGFLFENENVNQLSEILTGIYNGCFDVDAIASAGQRKVIETFGVEQMVDMTERVYHELVNGTAS